jgi:RNA polymerase subunit RPABC4/transcription elongation factor Spt4
MQTVFELIRTLVAPAAQVLLALTGAYLVTLWLTLIIWTFRDIEGRSRSVITQIFATLLVVFFFLPGVLLYIILRPKETLDEAYQRALQEEYLIQDLEELPLCHSCRRYVQGDYVLCPHCHSRLRENCPSCQRLVELRWDICPYCTSPLPGPDESLVEPGVRVERPVSLPEWVSPALQRFRDRLANLRERAAAEPGLLTEGSPDHSPPLADGDASAAEQPAASAAEQPAAPSPTNGHHAAEAADLTPPARARSRSRARTRPAPDDAPANPSVAPAADTADAEVADPEPAALGRPSRD